MILSLFARGLVGIINVLMYVCNAIVNELKKNELESRL